MNAPSRTVGRTLAFALGFAALTASDPARATVVWTATMEKGDLSEWTSQTNGTIHLDAGVRTNILASTDRAYSGSYSCKVTVHPDDIYGMYLQDRADTKHNSTLTGEGKDSWLSGYYFLPEDAKTRNEIAFYETMMTSRNWMDLWIEPKTGGGTTVKFGIESNGANLGSVLVWTGEWKVGVWHQWAIHVHWSTDATKGLVDLWWDGQQVITGYKHKTKYDTNDMFFQTGLHRVLTQPYTETIYFDDMIEADALADAKLMAANPNGNGSTGTDGGSGTDASGAAGANASDASGAAGSAGAAGAGGTTGTAGAAGGAAGTSTGAAGATTGTAGAPGAAGAIGMAGASGSAGMTTTMPPQGRGGTSGCSMVESSSPARARWLAGVSVVAICLYGRRRRRRL
jgi:hypothetical protein